jgi:indolepyruvate ferredoxin oxidoreductase
VDARRVAEALFGDYLATNLITLGVAYQAGLVPISATSIERAIELNGVQVQQNLQAFRYGRLFVADEGRLRQLAGPRARSADEERERVMARLTPGDRHAYLALVARCDRLDSEARRMLAIRIGELIEYQDAAYAAAYVDDVLAAAGRERDADGRVEITHAVIRHLYKLMAYKDEYEVARLHLRSEFTGGLRDLFVEPRRVSYLLHPPVLRAAGLKRKLELGPWFTPVLRGLRGLRRLRGTRFDVFGYARVRQEERSLIPWYRSLVRSALEQVTPENYAIVLDIASLPDRIRGYEQIKLDAVAATRREAEVQVSRLGSEHSANPRA